MTWSDKRRRSKSTKMTSKNIKLEETEDETTKRHKSCFNLPSPCGHGRNYSCGMKGKHWRSLLHWSVSSFWLTTVFLASDGGCRVGNTHRVRMSASVCTNWHKIPTNTNKHTTQPKTASKSPQSGLKYLETRRKWCKTGRKWQQSHAALANQIPQRHKRTKNITKTQKIIINSWEITKKWPQNEPSYII